VSILNMRPVGSLAHATPENYEIISKLGTIYQEDI
jgi:hypothetical protein